MNQKLITLFDTLKQDEAELQKIQNELNSLYRNKTALVNRINETQKQIGTELATIKNQANRDTIWGSEQHERGI